MARQSELDELRKEVAAMREATSAALPKDFGVDAALQQSDAESTYIANWAASHAEPTDSFLPGPPDTNAIMAPSVGEIAAEAKAAKKASAKTAAPKKAAASKSTAPKTVKVSAPAKSKAAAPQAAAPKAAPKKAKPAGDKA